MRECVIVLLTCFGVGDTVELKEIGASLPTALQGFKFTRRQAFDRKELGYSVSYTSKACAMTIIVYDLGENNIPDGKDNASVAAQLRRSVADLHTVAKKGTFQNLQPMAGELPLPKPVLETFAAAGFTFDTKAGSKCKSYILVTGRQQHFVKLRVTQYIVEQKTNDEELGEFLQMLTKAVRAK